MPSARLVGDPDLSTGAQLEQSVDLTPYPDAGQVVLVVTV